MSTSSTRGRLLLGTAAESFERFRLGYPDEVVDRTLGFAGREVRRALEIGAGTGKAARAFASRGVRVTALEADPDMFAVLERESLGMQVEPVRLSLEEYDGPPTDLVYAAASWHYTDPRDRCARIAARLVPGGVLAVFDSPVRLTEPDLQAAVTGAGLPVLDEGAGRSTADELAACDRLTDVEEHLVAREAVLPRREYVGYLSTVPDYRRLAARDQSDVLRRVGELLPATVRLDVPVRLHLARRT